MQILRKKLTKSEFEAYVSAKNFGTVPPTKIVLHHTWRPTQESWSGIRTIDGLKRYYEGLGWSAGPHIFVADDGIWLFTDMSRVGIHAGSANATWLKNGRKRGGYYVPNAKLIDYSIGIEVVGDYDEHVWEGATLDNALSCIITLKKKLGIITQDIAFHRDFSPKSCPGNAITRSWFEQTLANYESHNQIPPEQGYRFKFSEVEAKKAMELGFLRQVDTETREIIAIGLTRVYERLRKEFHA